MKEPINLHETLWQPRQLLGLGDSPSAQVEASRYLKKWSAPDGFLDRHPAGNRTFYSARKPA